MNVVVTGANGFVGRRVCAALGARGDTVTAAVRDAEHASTLPPVSRVVSVGDLASDPEWGPALTGADVVIHLAGRAHIMRERDEATLYDRVNRVASCDLARAAASAGVGRFVFVSTIKVLGDGGESIHDDRSVARAADPYSASKLAAEECLAEYCARCGMELVIVRPPLVYGPGVRGNFLKLLSLTRVAHHVPLPLASVRNARSMMFVDNLASVLVACANVPAAAAERFVVSDGVDWSTPDLIRHLARAMSRRSRLAPCPPRLLRAVAWLGGVEAAMDRLVGSLRVDGSRARRVLAWDPPIAPLEGLRATAAWYAATLRDRA